jgi:DNA-binding CsgD family transcriptional regulator
MSALTFENWTANLGMGLAERELQCVMAVASGLTSKQAARELGVAKDTVDKRLLAASTKLGVIKRAQLVAEAMRRGMISPMVITMCAVLVGHSIESTNDEFTRVRRPGERKLVESRTHRRAECALAVA